MTTAPTQDPKPLSGKAQREATEKGQTTPTTPFTPTTPAAAAASRLSPRLALLGLPPLAVAAGLGALGAVRYLQHQNTFAPERFPTGNWNPQRHGLEVEDVWFRSSDEVELHGWFFRQRHQPESRGAILYCHGNSGSLGTQIRTVRSLLRLGCDLFAFDYRGYGRSAGSPSEEGLYIDAESAFGYLRQRVGDQPILVFGHSLGGAVAIETVSRQPATALVVQSSFTSAKDMARIVYPQVPLHWVARNQFRSAEKVGRLALPKLFVHGSRDIRIPLSVGRDLFNAAAEPKENFEVSGGGHDDLATRGGSRYLERLRDFCERTLSEASAG